jgi:hypothetical protein
MRATMIIDKGISSLLHIEDVRSIIRIHIVYALSLGSGNTGTAGLRHNKLIRVA